MKSGSVRSQRRTQLVVITAVVLILAVILTGQTAAGADSSTGENQSEEGDPLDIPPFLEFTTNGTHGGQCMDDATNDSYSCSANDVRIASYVRLAGPTTCVIGERIAIALRSTIESGPQRYDIGIWLDEGGGNAREPGNTCYRDYLNPISIDNVSPAIDLSSGFGAFFNAELNDSADV